MLTCLKLFFFIYKFHFMQLRANYIVRQNLLFFCNTSVNDYFKIYFCLQNTNSLPLTITFTFFTIVRKMASKEIKKLILKVFMTYYRQQIFFLNFVNAMRKYQLFALKPCFNAFCFVLIFRFWDIKSYLKIVLFYVVTSKPRRFWLW